MNCFYHPTQPAIGQCKHCQRGLCSECAAVVDDVLACIKSHKEEVHKQEKLTARNLLQSERVRSVYMKNFSFYGLVGVAFVGFGWWQLDFLGLQAALFMALGVLLLYAALTNFLEGKKYK